MPPTTVPPTPVPPKPESPTRETLTPETPTETRRPRFSLVPVLIAVFIAAFAGLVGTGIVLEQPAQFRSNSVVEMRRPDLFLDVNPGTITVLNQLRSKYAALIRTEPVVQPTADELGMDPEVVRSSIAALVTADSLLFYPVATASRPEDAEAIAQEATEQLVAYAAAEQRAVSVPGNEQIELRIVQDATESTKLGPDTRRATIVGLAAALIFGGSAYVALEFGWFRRRRAKHADGGRPQRRGETSDRRSGARQRRLRS